LVRGHGILVTDLNKNDFEILDNGKRQEISYFAHQADVPLNVALLVDVSGSVFEIIGDEKLTAGQFLEQVLRLHDRGTIVSFADSVVLWQDFTSSMDLLRAGLTNLKDVGAHTHFLRRNPKQGGTALYDAITTTLTQKFPLQTGTKVVIVISDGLDTISQGTLESAVGAAQAMEVVVYSICREDPGNSEVQEDSCVGYDPLRLRLCGFEGTLGTDRRAYVFHRQGRVHSDDLRSHWRRNS